MLTSHTKLGSLHKIMTDLNIQDTHLAIIFPYIAGDLGIFFNEAELPLGFWYFDRNCENRKH